MKTCSNCGIEIKDTRSFVDKCSPCYFVGKKGRQNLIKVYEAGPIDKRQSRELAPEDTDYQDAETIDELYEYLFNLMEIRGHGKLQWIRTGPWSLSCDHSCAHAIITYHGMSPSGCFQSKQFGFDRTQIKNIALSGIDNAQVIMATISKADAYGTIAEIGYAISKKKPIVFNFIDINPTEYWFMIEMSRPLIDKIPPNFWTQYPSPYQNKEAYVKHLNNLALKYPSFESYMENINEEMKDIVDHKK